MTSRASLPTLLALLIAVSPFIATAQASPVPDTASTNPFTIAIAVNNLPVPEAEVWLVRYNLEPGGSVPQLNQPGPALVVVERGEVTLISNKPIMLKNTLGTPQPSMSTSSKGATKLAQREGALIPAETRLGMTNTSGQPSQVLVLKVFSPELKRRASIPTGIPTFMPSDVIVQPLSSGLATFKSDTGLLVIERNMVEPQHGTASGIFNGVEIGALEHGSAQVNFLSGNNWIWPSILTNYEQSAVGGPVPLNPRAVIDLSPGDGFTSRNGHMTWQSTGNEPLIITRAIASSTD